MSLRRSVFFFALLYWACPSFGQEPAVVEQPHAIEPPITTAPQMVGNPSFGEMVFEEPSDWWPTESPSNYWVTGEYWFGWMKGANLPPLVTTSPAGTPNTTAGILGRNTTDILLSGRVNDDMRSGFRFQTGYWLDREYGLRLEAGTSFLASQSTQFDFNSTDFPILARPYTDISLNGATPAPNDTISTPQAILIAHPDPVDGSTGLLSIKAKSGSYYDANVDIAESIYKSEHTNVDALIGYRFGRFADRIQFHQRINPNSLPNSQIDSDDEFSAVNTFHGVDFGFRGEIERGNLSLTLLGKMGAGSLNRKVNISGQTTQVITGVGTTTSPGGIYALSPNLGNHQDSVFTIFPEYGATLKWRVRQNLRVHIGYRAMIMFDAIRAVDQIDFSLNPAFIPPVTNANSTPRRPHESFSDDKFWIQSLTIGGEWSF